MVSKIHRLGTINLVPIQQVDAEIFHRVNFDLLVLLDET